MAAQQPLQLRVLGELTLIRRGRRIALPPSKKTRALLAYLAVSGRPHRRERLCSLLWDVPDDPRGALRWSLSKLRPLVDEPAVTRIVADRDTVAFDATNAHVDLLSVRRALAKGVGALDGEALKALAEEFRGEFLDGLDLSEFHEFRAWCVAEREEARRMHAGVLHGLISRLNAQPEAALPYARALAQIDPYDEAAHAALVRLLGTTGRRSEAEQQYEAGARLLAEVGATTGELRQAWLALRAQAAGAAETPPRPAAAVAPAPFVEAEPGAQPALVGREQEWTRLTGALREVISRRRERVLLLTGEPGVGKSRLLAELIAAARAANGTVLDGAAYEAERTRPYGPWVDALRRVPQAAVGKTIGGDLAPLLPEWAPEAQGEHTRNRLFGAVVELIAARAHSSPPVLLALDDVQWCDDASAELLHYVARMQRTRPVLVALAARGGELMDNGSMCRVLRSMRRDRLLDEIKLGPLSRSETATLVNAVAPDADAERVFAESAGNPLFALEVARSLPYRQDDVPLSLRELVADRIERLPATAAEVLRWAAVLGQTFDAARLRPLPSIDAEASVAALETLEWHGLLQAVQNPSTAHGSYAFAHEVVRRVVYTQLSEPRRRLMHARIAQDLHEREDPDDVIAAEIAHHATLAGEAELAARACVAAGRRCLRVFANAEAYALARRGIHFAEQLREPERVKLLLELTQIRVAARRPSQLADAARRIEELAERALDHGCSEHARLGFHMASYLRWERGEWSDAQRHTLRAELVSRAADDKERVVAMAEAARCLALLERDLPQAEALLLESGALSARLGLEPAAIPDATGMLRLHEGRLDEAAQLFEQSGAGPVCG
jgi:DNA-binding SARP family transcriptional activator